MTELWLVSGGLCVPGARPRAGEAAGGCTGGTV